MIFSVSANRKGLNWSLSAGYISPNLGIKPELITCLDKRKVETVRSSEYNLNHVLSGINNRPAPGTV
jgi:hypothetical protein